MTLIHIAAFTVGSILLGFIKSYKFRSKLILFFSLIVVYWLQPATSIRYLEYWLPTLMIGLVIVVYAICFPDKIFEKGNLIGLGMSVGIPLAVGLLRYFRPLCCITSSLPPRFLSILGWLVILMALLAIVMFTRRYRLSLQASLVVTIIVFIFIKNDTLVVIASRGLRGLTGQDPDLASSFDLVWLGYSYWAFRLLHIIRDKQNQRLAEINIFEFVSYLFFFPSFTAGPIDRVEKFANKMQKNIILNSPRFINGMERLFSGLFKKFVLADSLALVSLSAQNADQIAVAQWGWVALYAYAFRILLDFSGYTDIAIGIGIFSGIQLPENFRKPYLQRNLTEFWNNWHITLTQWFRAYFFNPLTRAFRSSKRKITLPAIILIGQLSTMVLIGLWHGIAWNFVVWGAWHGMGLFIHNRWGALNKQNGFWIFKRESENRWVNFLGTLLNFHFVALGWIWFVIPDIKTGWDFFSLLFGGI